MAYKRVPQYWLCEGNPSVTNGLVMRNFDVLFVAKLDKQFEQTFGIPVFWDTVALT